MNKNLEDRLEENRAQAIDFKPLFKTEKPAPRETEYELPPGLISGIELKFEDSTIPLNQRYTPEQERFPELRRLTPEPTTYLLIKTDSSNRGLAETLYEKVVAPMTANLGHTDDTKFKIMVCLAELYKNSIIFANRASPDKKDYTKRDTDDQGPTPEELKENMKKPIYIEVLATRTYAIVRVSDNGPGFDPAAKIDTAQVPDDYKDLPPEMQAIYLKDSGRGMFFIQKFTGELPLVNKTNSCSVSCRIYNTDSLEATLPEQVKPYLP
jgi:anti-sigma regulatory factor (Ser/Thr protein kinase)